MKKIFTLLLLFSATLSYGATRTAEQAICENNETIDFCLSKLLEFKCLEYAPKDTADLWQDEKCLNAAQATTKILNPDNEFGEPVVFTTELANLLKQQEVVKYIHDLRATLESAVQDRTPFSLWDFTSTATEHDFAKTIEWLGVLLQDTSVGAPFLHYISDKHLAADDTLRDLVLSVGYLRRADEHPNFTVQFPLFNDDLTKVFYHFYPIAYLSMRLRAAGVDQETALWLPFLFNTTYKLRDIAKNTSARYWPIVDPKSIQANQISNVKDIYAGYLAAYMAQGKTPHAMKWEQFGEGFSSAPGAFMRQQCARTFAAEEAATSK